MKSRTRVNVRGTQHQSENAVDCIATDPHRRLPFGVGMCARAEQNKRGIVSRFDVNVERHYLPSCAEIDVNFWCPLALDSALLDWAFCFFIMPPAIAEVHPQAT
jgi:hypothetical protein